MTTAPALPHRTQKHSSRRNPSHSLRTGGRAGRRCVWCDCRLPVDSRATTCSPSCRSQLSRRKRKLADAACVTAFDWQPGDGEALVKRYGLPMMEHCLNLRGVVWVAARKEWTFEADAARAA
jgi:hypothetical protein